MKKFANLASSVTKEFESPDGYILGVGLKLQQTIFSDKVRVCLKANFRFLPKTEAVPRDADRLLNIELVDDKIVVSVPIDQSKKLSPVSDYSQLCDRVRYKIEGSRYVWLCEKMKS